MKMNTHFIFWYYGQGLRSALFLLGNSLRYVLYRFYVGGLFRTLLSPWKRDKSFQTWNGLHPTLFLQMVLNNIIARFFGMILRLIMIFIASLVFVFTLIMGIFFSLVYASVPILIIGGIVLFPFSQIASVLCIFLGVCGLGGAFLAYTMREADFETFDITELKRKKIFPRILNRLGLNEKNLNQEALQNTEALLQFLRTLNIDEVAYQRAVMLELHTKKERDRKRRFWLWENLHKIKPIGKDWHYAYTPHLDHYAVDLAKYDPTEYRDAPLIGKDNELNMVAITLLRPIQNSVIFVGEPGIGRKTFIHSFARLVRQNAFGTRDLDEARVLLFDLGQAVSDATSRGEDRESFLRSLFSEATYAGNVILAIENIDQYLEDDGPQLNLSSLFSEFLQWPNFRVMATASANHYHDIAHKNEQLLKFFEVIYLKESTKEETFTILVQKFEKEERKNIIFTLQALDTIISLAERYNWETPFPERAIDLAQEVLLYWQSTGEKFITPEIVNGFIAIKTGIPTGILGEEEKAKLLKLEELLHKRVIGQNEAIKQVAEAMRKSRAGFGDDKRPLGSFIFFGSTGVGKTETAKAFAESYFGSEDSMIRLDMSEYQTAEAVVNLIGSREIGMQGRLTSLAKEHPFSILLLDEIEKANPKALDLFLQILDEGYVTDSDGKRVSFRNMIIIATSNAGSMLIKKSVAEGINMVETKKQIMDFILENNIFRLEFLNRFDGMIFFEPLKPDELISVVLIKLKKFTDRLKKEKNITVGFDSGVAQKIVEQGYEPIFGARSLNRYIEDTIEDVIVKKIIAGEIVSGGSLIISSDEL